MVAATKSGLWGSIRRDMSLGYNLPPSFRGSSSGFPTPKTWLRLSQALHRIAWSMELVALDLATCHGDRGGATMSPKEHTMAGGLISSLPPSTKQRKWEPTTHEAVRFPPLDHGTQPVHIFQLVNNRRLAFFFFIAEVFLLPLAKESCRQFQHRTTKIARRGSNFCQLACLASQEEGRGKLGGNPTWYVKWIPLPRLRPPGPGVPSSPPSPRMDWAAHMSTHQQPKVQCSFLVPMRTPESITIAAAEASNDSGWHTCLQDSCAEAKAEKRSRELGLRQRRRTDCQLCLQVNISAAYVSLPVTFLS